jgi:DNA-binding GntR family transcriptional regulator
VLKLQEAHWKIIDALEAGDGNLAGELLRKHIYNLPANESADSPRTRKSEPQK